MSVVQISSKEQFISLLSASRLVVADFYADWCGPCKTIAPVYEQLATQLTRPKQITFTKINVDQQQDLAKTYGVTAMPTFIVFKNGRVNETVKGANPSKLNSIVQKLASEASQSDDASPGEGSSGDTWIGGTVAKGYSDITDQVDFKGLELLNRDTELAAPRTLFGTSKPSSLAGKGKGKGKENSAADWVESDTDEQLMLYIPFQSTLKVHSLQITSLPPADGDDETPMRPRNIHIYKNTAHVLGFDEADGIPPVQKVEIQAGDWDEKTATATVGLRFVNFQSITSLVLFFIDGDGESEKLRVDRIRVIGEAGEKRSMGKLEKIGDEPGE